MQAGSLHEQARLRVLFKDVTVHGKVVAAGTSILPVITGRAKYTIFVQKVVIMILTDAAQSLTLRDTNSTPKVIIVQAASPGLGLKSWDFGDDGVPLTEGKDLDLVLSAAGLAFNYEIYAYLKPTATMIPSEI
jgi:hypothetical protein